MKQFWNERYSQSDYVYGTEPNEYFKEKIQQFEPGKLLLPAEGEGRNAIFAARLGWKVTAFDWSEVAQRKAVALAEANQVQINYWVSEVDDLAFEEGSFDAIAFIYAHFPADVKLVYNQKILSFLKRGGTLIFEAFSKRQLDYQKTHRSGGPSDINMLYSIEEVKNAFPGVDFLTIEEREIYLEEGMNHSGLGSVVRALGIKK